MNGCPMDSRIAACDLHRLYYLLIGNGAHAYYHWPTEHSSRSTSYIRNIHRHIGREPE